MQRICACVFALILIAAGSAQERRHGELDPREDPLDQKLPSGKSQREEIAKEDHKKNLDDSAALMRLAQEVHEDLDKSGSGVVSVKMLKQLDEMEKLTRGIRGRLKRY